MPKLFMASPNASGQIQSRRAGATTFGSGAGLQQVGQDIAALGKQMEKRAETQELSEVRKQLSVKRVEWTKHLYASVENMGPGGVDFTANIIKDFQTFTDDSADQYKTGAGRRAWAEGQVILRGDLAVRAIAIEAEARGKKAVADYGVGLQAATTTLEMDPTQLQHVLAEQLATIDGMSVNDTVKQTLREEALSDLGEATVRGEIRLDPLRAEANLKDGVYSKLLDGDDTKRLLGEVRMAQTAERVEAGRLKKAADDAQESAVNNAVDELYRGIYSSDPTERPSISDIINHPALRGSARQRAFLVSAQRDRNNNQFNNTTDPFVFRAVMADIRLGKITNPMAIREYSGNGLGTSEVNAAVRYLEDTLAVAQGLGTPEQELGLGYVEQTESFIDGFRTTITRTNANQSHAQGDQRFMQFDRAVRLRVAAELAKGEDGDVSALFDPANTKFYLGPLVNSYRMTNQERMTATIDLMQTGGANREVGNMMFSRGALVAGATIGGSWISRGKEGPKVYEETEEAYRERIGKLVSLGFTTLTPRRLNAETMEQFSARVKIMREEGATPWPSR